MMPVERSLALAIAVGIKLADSIKALLEQDCFSLEIPAGPLSLGKRPFMENHMNFTCLYVYMIKCDLLRVMFCEMHCADTLYLITFE